MYHNKKIGIFVSHIYGTYQQNFCQGAVDKATEFGYLAEIFASNDGENFGSYGFGENSILKIPNFEDFSGIIVVADTYVAKDLLDQLLRTLEEQCTCPIIVNSTSKISYPCVNIDNNSPTIQLLEHLISVHKYKRICFLGNTLETEYSQKRYKYYLDTMKAHNFPVETHDSFECGYSEEDADKALSFFLSKGKKPDAIVCYNDRMALLMMHALSKRGLSVPEDVALTGFDASESGQNCGVPLTTVTFPSYEEGIISVENIVHILAGEEVPPVTIVPAEPLIGRSCGCPSHKKESFITYSQHLNRRIEHIESSLIDDIHMSANLQDISDIDVGMDLLEKYVGNIKNCKEFYLCLYPRWNSASRQIRELTLDEDEFMGSSMLLKLGIKDGKRLAECSFTKSSALPDYIYSPASTYIYSPLYFGKKSFGYIAIAFENNQLAYEFKLINWLMNVNSMLKNICDNKNMRMLMDRLEDIYMRDELTGHYNRHGFEIQSKKLAEKALKRNQPLLAIIFDLDNYGIIKDTFGHQEGDFAIEVLGQALVPEPSGEMDFACARLESDRFYILITGITQKYVSAYLNRVDHYLDSYNQLNSKAYKISASSGYAWSNPQIDFDSHDLFGQAEKEMLEEKKRKL